MTQLNSKLFPVASFNSSFNNYLPTRLTNTMIYQSVGLEKHILKRHPECIINHPDYIGVNPNELGASFELVKIFDKNIQIGIKLDIKDDYLYVATLHSITDAKLQHGIANGRLKKI